MSQIQGLARSHSRVDVARSAHAPTRTERHLRRPSNRSSDIVIVANRLPVSVDHEGVHLSPGGLVSALTSVVDSHSRWIGWSEKPLPDHGGNLDDQPTLQPIMLSEGELAGYYEGFANSVLWPLLHGRLQPVEFNRDWWDAFVTVNQRFADAAIASVPLGGTVWVHDYHLLLVPGMMRAERPDLRIGLFLHIPFPAPQIFDILPWRTHIVEGMLGADLIGLQTPADAENFRAIASSRADAPQFEPTRRLRHEPATIEAFPISVDFERWDDLGAHAARNTATLRRELQADTVFLGVDRLDYTKGIAHRIDAFGKLLDDGHLPERDCVFVQVAVPSRTTVSAYADERDLVEAAVERVNARHRRRDGSPVVQYHYRNLSPSELATWYRAADVLVVTPLADGMNLVAKEFVAARGDLDGALVLSEFAGAAHDLEVGATLVNPYDIDAVMLALCRAARLPRGERMRRMQSMRGVVRVNDVKNWATSFLGRLHDVCRPSGHRRSMGQHGPWSFDLPAAGER